MNEVIQMPSNLEAERAVLGSILIDPDAGVQIGGNLSAGDFFNQKNAWVYEAIQALNERWEPIDLVTLADELESNGHLSDIGGLAYLVGLNDATPTGLHVMHHAKIVKDASAKRNAIQAASKIAEMAYDPAYGSISVIEEAERLLYGLSEVRREDEPRHVGEIATSVLDRIEYISTNPDVRVGLPTGFKGLDNALGGLQRGNLIIVAARPGMGKSSLAASIALNTGKQFGARVGFFSLEMSNEELVQRLMSIESGIDSRRLRAGDIAGDDEYAALYRAADTLASTSIYIDDTPALSVATLRSKARRLHAEHGLDLLIVDYMQLMTGQGTGRSENRQQEISYISRSLQALSRELNIPVLALSQLSRAVEQRADKRPVLSDLRESGAIEQDASVVMFIYREDYYIEDTDRQNIADIIVAKHRHGSTGAVSLYFRKELTQFNDLEIERTDLV